MDNYHYTYFAKAYSIVETIRKELNVNNIFRSRWNILKNNSRLSMQELPFVFLAGGALASTVQGEAIKDYDLFCVTKEVQDKFKKCLYDNKKVQITSVTDRAVSFVLNGKLPYYQLVLFDYGHPQCVIDRFDWVHCRAAVTLGFPPEHVIHPEFLDCAYHKILKRDISDYGKPFNFNMARTQKFLDRGYELYDETREALDLLARVKDGTSTEKTIYRDFVGS